MNISKSIRQGHTELDNEEDNGAKGKRQGDHLKSRLFKPKQIGVENSKDLEDIIRERFAVR